MPLGADAAVCSGIGDGLVSIDGAVEQSIGGQRGRRDREYEGELHC